MGSFAVRKSGGGSPVRGGVDADRALSRPASWPLAGEADITTTAGAAFLRTLVGFPGGRADIWTIPYARLDPVGIAQGVEVRVYDGANPSQLLAILDGARQAKWLDTLDDVGSGSFLLATSDPKAQYIQRGNIVRMHLHGVARFAYVIDSPTRRYASPSGAVGEYWEAAGRGAVALLDRAKVVPGTGLYSTITLPGALAAQIDAASVAARPVLSGRISYDFDASTDSAGDTWTDASAYQFSDGQSYLDIWHQLAAIGIETRVTPALVLQAFVNGLGRDVSSEVVIEEGRHLRGEVDRRYQDAQIGTRAYVAGKSGSFLTVYGDESDPRLGVHELYISVSTTDDYGVLKAIGDKALEDSQAAASALHLPLNHGRGFSDLEPYVDFNVGDTVTLRLQGEVQTTGRVAAITIEARDDGEYNVDVDFNAAARSGLMRLRRVVAELGAGTFLGYR